MMRGRRRVHAAALVMVVIVVLLAGTSIVAAPRAAAAQSTDTPISCTIGVDLLSLHAFNLVEKTFDAEFWIWSVCPDNRFKPLTNLQFVNANASTVSLQGESVVDAMYWDYANVVGTFRYDWDLTDFPFDRHTLQIVIENSEEDATSLVFVPDTAGSVYEPDLPMEGWRVTNFDVASAPFSYHTTYGDPSNPVGSSNYSRFTVDIALERAEYDSFFKLTFVVYLAFLLSLVSYFVNLQNPALLAARLSVIVGALFAVAVNLRTTTTALSIEEKLTLVDKIHVVAMVAILISAIATVSEQMLVARGSSGTQVKRFDRNIMIIVVIGYVAINMLLIGHVALKNP